MAIADYFFVLGLKIKDDESLQNALKEAKKVYDLGYEERYQPYVRYKW